MSWRLFWIVGIFLSALELNAQFENGIYTNKDYLVLTVHSHNSGELSVYKDCLISDSLKDAHPVYGRQLVRQDSFYFYPIVPFSYDQDYSILMNGEIHCFQIEKPGSYELIQVEKVYPSITSVPANMLKWYVQFSKPVNPANIYQHISFTDATGNKLERMVLNLENALLSEDGKTLTIWVEPGRQKRNLGPNRELGPVFVSGRSYRLVIDKLLKDENGIGMSKEWHYDFVVASEDRNLIQPQEWEISPATKGSREALVINFKETLDFGSSLDGLVITDSDDQVIPGKWSLGPYEQSIKFSPRYKWVEGTYYIIISDFIEDLAGNRVNRLFDQPINGKKDPGLNEFVKSRAFKI